MANVRVHTYSIAGYDPETHSWGIAVASKWLAVGAIVPHVQQGVGAVVTQAFTNTAFGPEGLSFLQQGATAQQTVTHLLEQDPTPQLRQLAVIDAKGLVAVHTGAGCEQYAGHRTLRHAVVLGNMLADEAVLEHMAEAFERTTGTLAQRLVAALVAGEVAGGDVRGKESAALVVLSADTPQFEIHGSRINLRVDHSSAPVEDLALLLQKHYATYAEGHEKTPHTTRVLQS